MTLDQIGRKYLNTSNWTDKCSHGHDYCRHYEKFFEPLRYQPIKLLEIGVNMGASIIMWLEYFPNAKIYGVDIEPRTQPVHDRYTFVQGDQSSVNFWNEFVVKHGSDWDVIIDDGGHTSGQIITSFACLWLHVKHGGLYVVEDLDEGHKPHCLTPDYDTHHQWLCKIIDAMNTGSGQIDVDSIYLANQLAILRKK